MLDHGTPIERSAPTIAAIGSLGVGCALAVIGFKVLGILVGLVILPALTVLWHEHVYFGVARRIAMQRLCLGCGYSLRRAPMDRRGCGRCPECGERFEADVYVRLVRMLFPEDDG